MATKYSFGNDCELVIFDVEAIDGNAFKAKSTVAIGMTLAVMRNKHLVIEDRREFVIAVTESDCEEAVWKNYWTKPNIWPTWVYYRFIAERLSEKEASAKITQFLGVCYEKYPKLRVGCDNPGFDHTFVSALLHRAGVDHPSFEFARTPDGLAPLMRKRTMKDGTVLLDPQYKFILDLKAISFGLRSPYASFKEANNAWWSNFTTIQEKFNFSHNHFCDNDSTAIMLNFFDAAVGPLSSYDISLVVRQNKERDAKMAAFDMPPPPK